MVLRNPVGEQNYQLVVRLPPRPSTKAGKGAIAMGYRWRKRERYMCGRGREGQKRWDELIRDVLT